MRNRLIYACLFWWLLLAMVAVAQPEPMKWSGVVIDDESAEYVGKWVRKATASALVGKSYRHSDQKDTGLKSASFKPDLPNAGRYEVRLLYVANVNRATNASVTIHSEDGETTRIVDQRQNCLVSGVPRSLGVFRFSAGK